MTLHVELGDADRPSRCECCGQVTRTVHGFVYRGDDAYAVYYAGWSEGHADRGVTMAIAVGEWGDDSAVSDRTSIGLRARSTASQIEFAVLDPDESPWGHTDLLGAMVPRAVALKHRVLKVIFEIAERVVRDDSRVAAFLQGGGQPSSWL